MLAISRSSSGSMPEQESRREKRKRQDHDADTFRWSQGSQDSLQRQILRYNHGNRLDTGHGPITSRQNQQSPGSGPAASSSSGNFEQPPDSQGCDLPSSCAATVDSTSRSSQLADCSPCRILHYWDFCSRGNLPCEASLHLIAGAMEGGPTQPATQPVPRTSKTVVSKNDAADVLCLIMPASGPALAAVNLIAQTTPQHILQNHHVDGMDELEDPLSYEAELPSDENGEGNAAITTSAAQMPPPPKAQPQISNGGTSRDIALRMSSQVHNPLLGFVFGRNAVKCDLLLGKEETLKLSNCHFRIFVNHNGVLMVEDTSTNGTIVDKVILCGDRANKKTADAKGTRILNNGSVIELPTINHPNAEWMRFIVRFPPREAYQEEYNQNLFSYLRWIEQQERQAKIAAQKNGGAPPPFLHPFNPLSDRAEASPNASIIGAATGDNIHGLDWHGGETYKFIKTIGKGAFAMVFQVAEKDRGEVFACKQIEKRRFIKDGVVNHKVHNEIRIMKDLEHTNIVRYIEYHETKNNIYIIMEYVSMGDLSVYTETGRAMPEYMCQMMAMQILNALQYLHDRSITHRDIKPDNILVASHQPYTFKLSDFGLSKIVSGDTFLKSFCGTLLYCAPEIYPGFQRAKLGLHPSKRTRSWEPRKGTMPYEHSVDIWSIAAVLFHLLCGHSPYTGSMDAEGALMLMNIMNTQPEWEYLDQAGISLSGRDFVQRALVIDPSERAREDELLKHRWLTGADGSPLDPLKVANNTTDDDVLDASQLSLQEQPVVPENERTQDDMENPRESKRARYHREAEDDEAPLDLFNGPTSSNWYGATAQWNDSQASAESRSDFNQFLPGLPGNRLFGEIGSSALRSSGVLGSNAQGALGVESHASDAAAEDDSYMHPETEGEEGQSQSGFGGGQSFNSPKDIQQHNCSNSDNDGLTRESLQYPQVLPGDPYAGAAPSLYGTEALVDQLRMTSPESSISAPSADSKPTTPKTPRDFDASNGPRGTSDSADPIQVPSSQVTPKQATAGRPIPIAGITESTDSHMGGQDADDGELRTGEDFAIDGEDQQESFTDLPQGQHDQGHRMNPSHPSSAQSSQSTDQGSNAPPDLDQETGSTAQDLSHHIPGLPPKPPVSDSATSNDAKPQDVFLKPQPRFGILTPTRGSIDTKAIKLETRLTSFGRDPKCTVTFADPMDDRIPKLALDIAFWYPGIERDTRNGKNNWHQKSNLVATISTRANTFIKINGIHLMKSKPDKKLFGKLYRDDEVTVFENAKTNECLKFKCNFFVGVSRYPRSITNPFKVVEMDAEQEKRLQEQREAKKRAAKAAAAQKQQQQLGAVGAAKADSAPAKPAAGLSRSGSLGARAASVASRSSAGRAVTRSVALKAGQGAGVSKSTGA